MYDRLTPRQRQTLLHSIEWRLRAVYLEKESWRDGQRVRAEGLGVFAHSHAYENFMWSLPAALLVAGDARSTRELVPLVLNYLAGVTSAHGPDEGWNEGLSYAVHKGQAMLYASMYTALLLPELELGRNPYYSRLGEWYAHLHPLGINRLSFGEYAAHPERVVEAQRNVFRMLSWLSGDGRARTRYDALVALAGNGGSDRPWLDLFGASAFALPEPAQERTRALFPEAGWVMASSQTPSDRERFSEAVGMIFQSRPRGGFSHSYRAENDFVWHAFGQTLSAGGGTTYFPDPHARHSMSHNVVLINGEGQEWDPRKPKRPFNGRLLAWREGDGFVHWTGDATNAYQTVPDLLRWHRHVVFLDDRVFILLDDLAMKPGAAPARFSWLLHVADEAGLEIEEGVGLRYRLGDVHARVRLGRSADELSIDHRRGRESFGNPITGEDLYPAARKALAGHDRHLLDESPMAHSVWVTNHRPARQWMLMSILSAWKDGEVEPRIEPLSEAAVRITYPDGTSRIVSFDPAIRGDVQINIDAIRGHAEGRISRR